MHPVEIGGAWGSPDLSLGDSGNNSEVILPLWNGSEYMINPAGVEELLKGQLRFWILEFF